MDCYPTAEQLLNLGLDAATFDRFINGQIGLENLNRNGVDVETLLTWRQRFQDSLNEFSEDSQDAIYQFEQDGAAAIDRVLGFEFRGSWAPNTPYERKDVVRYDDLEYITMVDHISSDSFEEDLDSGRWSLYTGISRAELASASGGMLVGLGDGTVQEAVQFITPEMYPTLAACFASAMISGRSILISQDTNIRIPNDAPTHADALRYTCVINPKARVYLTFSSGFRPSSGATIECGDYSNYFIRSIDSSIILDASSPFSGTAFLTVYNGTAPTIDTIIDCNKRSNAGVDLVWSAKIRVLPTRGVVNAIGINLEARGSRADCTEAIFDGAGDVGLRVQQTSTVRAQQSRADNCGRAGYEVSRASTCNVMLARAQNCGHQSPTSEINQGGLVVRRSLVAANEFNGSGSTRGLSCQLSATVEGGQMVLEDCSIHGIRASTMSRVSAASTSYQRSAIGIEIGNSSTIDATSGNFLGCPIPWTRFGSGTHLTVSASTYDSASRPNVAYNSPTFQGMVYDSGAPAIMEISGGYRTASLSLAVDTATSILIPGTGSRQCLVSVAGNGVASGGLVWMRFGSSPNSSIVAAGTVINVATGILAGTTGVAGRITLSATADRLYIENRFGAFDIGITIESLSFKQS